MPLADYGRARKNKETDNIRLRDTSAIGLNPSQD